MSDYGMMSELMALSIEIENGERLPTAPKEDLMILSDDSWFDVLEKIAA